MRDSDAQTETDVYPAEVKAALRERLLIWGTIVLLSAGTLVYAFTRSFVWDEGFHLLAAQLILAGKKPYLDFCFPQTPLNAYWNAAWMKILGQSWRISHIPAALAVIGSTVLLCRYLQSRLPETKWRTTCVFAGLLLFAANSEMFQFGPIAQAYAICVLSGLAAFVFAVNSVECSGIWRPLAAGLCAGIGSASSLLSAPLAAVLFVWLSLYTRNRGRVLKCVFYVAGCLIPFAPVFWLFAQNPHVVWFNLVEYQAIFRRADWAGSLATTHDVDVLSSWIDDGQALLLLLLSAASTIWVSRDRNIPERFRREFWLSFWITLVLALYISTAHPTFSRYYVVGMPMFVIIAVPGLMVVGSRLVSPERPFWPGAVLAFLLLFGLGRALFDERDGATWQRYEEIAADVAKVTPPSARLFADEHVYFLLHRIPPPGLEFSYSHKVDIAPKQAALLHIIPAKQLEQQMKAGVYATVESCDDDKIDDWQLASHYKNRKDIEDCSVFWGFEGKHD